MLSGSRITQLRDSTYLIDIIARAVPEERAKLDTLRNLMIPLPNGRSVPLEQVASLSYTLEPALIWRRQRLPTVTVQADVVPGVEATTVIKQMQGAIADFQAKLPAGYRVVLGGVIEDSAKAQASIFVVFPLMLFLMVTILMVQLMSFQRLFLVLLTAPLALIGVAGALLLSGSPMGFVAILGVISLAGMVIRNSVILISQIDEHIAAGRGALGRGDQRDRASAAPDPAHGGGCHPWHDPHRSYRVLGTDGLRCHGRARGSNAAHPRVPARALRHLVQD